MNRREWVRRRNFFQRGIESWLRRSLLSSEKTTGHTGQKDDALRARFWYVKSGGEIGWIGGKEERKKHSAGEKITRGGIFVLDPHCSFLLVLYVRMYYTILNRGSQGHKQGLHILEMVGGWTHIA